MEYNDYFNRVQVKMSQTTELILGIVALILVITLTRKYHAWRLKRAYIFIIDDLKKNYLPLSRFSLEILVIYL